MQQQDYKPRRGAVFLPFIIHAAPSELIFAGWDLLPVVTGDYSHPALAELRKLINSSMVKVDCCNVNKCIVIMQKIENGRNQIFR